MADRPEQKTFDLSPAASYARDDFLVSDCNRTAWDYIERYPDWPAPALVLYGPAGCGKTHLAHIWQEKSGAHFVSLAQMKEIAVPATGLVLEDVQSAMGDAAVEQHLFHLYNICQAQGQAIFLTAEHPPAQWSFVLPDLKSRLCAAPAVEVGLPDDMLMAVLLSKQFSDRQLKVTPEVIAYLLPRLERSHDAARRIVAEIDSRALAHKRDITVPFVRDVLGSRA